MKILITSAIVGYLLGVALILAFFKGAYRNDTKY